MVAHAQVIEQIDERAVVDIGARQLADEGYFRVAVKEALKAERHIQKHGALAQTHLVRHRGTVNLVADIGRPVHAADELRELVG